MQKKKEEYELSNIELEKEVIQLKSKPSGFQSAKLPAIPNHLSGVQEKHLPSLRGYRMRYMAEPNGACAQNCVAVHIYEDEDEGPKVKKRINHHIADHWETYYKHKIALPYVETVGVGEHSKTIRISSKEEMLAFLRSEEALMVYTNSHELLATANLFNVNINIFTYGGSEDKWTEIRPDPEMVADAEVKLGKLIPDIALYHSFETHFDLLVKNDSRLALLGLLAGSAKEDSQGIVESDGKIVDEWHTVKNKRSKAKNDNGKKSMADEQLLVEEENYFDGTKDLDEEITLVGFKNGGHRRAGPQESPESASNFFKMFKCVHCTSEFQSKGLLEAHIKTHDTNFTCNDCSKTFQQEVNLNEHMNKEHREDEWNCMDCSFQGNCVSDLIKHLKLTAHQPSKTISDKRKLFRDYKQCYTCKMDFDGYFNLMNHRKAIHPSSKKCRNFPGNCKFANNCWYVHDEQMESEEIHDNFKCDLCEVEIKGRDNFMKHKKNVHPDNIPTCDNFRKSQCTLGEKECWFEHKTEGPKLDSIPSTKPSEKQVIREAFGNTFPPDQLKSMLIMIGKLFTKVENIEKRFEDLMN